ncbi:MAG: polymorphic toxin-type HINT domain-containing protein [Dysosmobacter sp.]
MATITLYKDKINGVGSLLDDIIKSSNNLSAQLGTLKSTLQGVDSSTCNLQDTVDSISSSSKSESDKVEDLKRLNNKLTAFIEMTAHRDSSAESEINKAKEDFYTKYSYLKPECEKSRMEKIADGMKKACEWCKEHWKLIATIVIVAVSIVVLLIPGVGPIIAGACWGAILGACIGGVSGGLDSMARGGSFLDGFEEGAFSGAITGAITGAAFAGLGQLGAALGKGIKCASTLGKFVRGTAAVTKVVSTAMGGFDTVALLDKAFGTGDIASLNAKLHESKAYNYFQVGVSAVAVLTNGMTSTMSCFVAGTLIMTAVGLVAIENIKVGDVVVSADPETVEVQNKPVVDVFTREVDRLVHLTINNEEIITTFDHPFYVKGKGFINATNLWIGAELVNKDGHTIVVENIFKEYLEDQTVKVYNFKVDDYHTYFVGRDYIWVHNADCSQIIKQVESGEVELENSQQKGNYGEMKMDQELHNNGYERISTDSVDSLNSPGHQGIDGVYYKEDGNPQYIIGEAKYGSSRLGNTKADGKQMSNNWINNRLDNALGDNTALSQAIKDEMILNPDNVATNLYHIRPDGAVDVTPLNNGVKIH